MDKERYLAKLDELDQFHTELMDVLPENFEHYNRIEIRRSCERLAQLLIESVLDVCSMLVRDLKLGLPQAEEDIVTKLEQKQLLSAPMIEKIKEMRKFRNIIIHRYGQIDDQLMFTNLRENHGDFHQFKQEVLSVLEKHR